MLVGVKLACHRNTIDERKIRDSHTYKVDNCQRLFHDKETGPLAYATARLIINYDPVVLRDKKSVMRLDDTYISNHTWNTVVK